LVEPISSVMVQLVLFVQIDEIMGQSECDFLHLCIIFDTIHEDIHTCSDGLLSKRPHEKESPYYQDSASYCA
jgi:hypothetical protein